MLVLASASPRRKELLKHITNDFDIIVSDFEENLPSNIAPMEIAEYFATKKAIDVFNKNKNNTVIGSDTVIVFNNKIYGKPLDKDDAKRMLLDFSNNTHFVVTGVCVVNNKNTISFSSINEVSFYNLSEKEIDDYLNCDEYKERADSL